MKKQISDTKFDGCCYNQKQIDRILAVLDGNGNPSLQAMLTQINGNISNMKDDICELKETANAFYDVEKKFGEELIRKEEREKYERKKEERLRWIVPLVVSNVIILATLLLKLIFNV